MTPQTARKPRAVRVAPGYVVLNLSGARGGVTYRTQVIADRQQTRQSRRVDSRVVKLIDNETFVREIDAVVKNVDDTVMRRLCVKMTFGHFVPEQHHTELHRQIAELHGKMVALNASAEAMGSAHRGRIGVLTSPLNVDDPHFVTECCMTITNALSDVYDAVRAGDIDDRTVAGRTVRNRLKPALLRAKNVELLPADNTLIVAALQCVRDAKPGIRAAVASGETPEAAGAAADLRPIERALQAYRVW